MIHAFEAHLADTKRYLLLDVESGAIHELDAAAFLVARALERGENPYESAPEDVVNETLQELDELREGGLLDTPEREANHTGETVIKAMCLHLAHDCNLRCKYCFASTGEYKGGRKLMPLEVGKRALDFLIARSKGRRNLEVDLFGGEPLMNFDVLKGIVHYGRELEREHGKVIRFTVTTNGLSLNAERIDYINREMHNVVLSLDGRREVHDLMRPTAGGCGSYDIILPKLLELVRKRKDGEYYVRGTFTSQNLDFTQDVRALRDAGFTQISLEPVVLDANDPYAIRIEHLPKIIAEYDKLAAFLDKSRKTGKWFNFFHFMMDFENGPCLKKRISGCGAGVEYVAVTPEGDIYPCHQFVGEQAFRLGTVLTETYAPMDAFEGCTVRTKPACKACWAKYFCSGGCAANAYKHGGSIFETDEIACALEKKRTECAIALSV